MINDNEQMELTQEDENEMWRQIEEDYLVNSVESIIIKPIDKYINKLTEKELLYKDCISCDSGMIFINDAIQILKEFNKEINR